MKPTPICIVIQHIRPFSAKRKLRHVAALIEIEKRDHGRTKRLSELEALAFSICFPQVQKAVQRLHS